MDETTESKETSIKEKIMRKYLLIVIGLSIFISCDKERSKPADEFILKSNAYTGFLFEKLKIINFPNSNNLKPDFVISPHITANGIVASPFFSHIDLENRFYLSGEFDSYENAINYYESYILPNDAHFQQFALPIKPNQVWLILTNNERYGVVLIKGTEFNDNNDTPYAEATFKAKMLSQD